MAHQADLSGRPVGEEQVGLVVVVVLTGEQPIGGAQEEEVAPIVTECERIGLKVLPPDVNESFPDFAVVKNEKSIRFGLGAIKNVGEKAARAIVEER